LFAGHQVVCAIDERAERWCWGNNTEGELGLGDSGKDTWRLVPTRADDGGGWSHVSVGFQWRSGSGIRTDGTLWYWAGSGMLAPLQYGSDTDWAITSVGSQTRLALKLDGRMWSDVTPVGADTDWAQAHAGWGHYCAIKTDGSLYCWGDNADGEIGIGTTGADVPAPTRVGTDTDWIAVGAGQQRTCGIKGAGELHCWGLGHGTTPARIGADADWVSLSYEWVHGCGLKRDGSLWCFSSTEPTPAPIALEGPWSMLTVGGHHACAFREPDARWYCWGAAFGLGTGSTTDSEAPVALCP
jgi:alpha-tubulin suppressor-like RCC1 family protein